MSTRGAVEAHPKDDQELRFPLASGKEVWQELKAQIQAVSNAGWLFLLAIIILGAGAWLNVTVPQLLGRIVDVVRASSTEAEAQLWELALIMAAATIGAAVLNALGFFLVSKIVERVIANLRESMVITALGLPTYKVEDAGTGDLVSRSTDDVSMVSSAVTETLPMLTGALFTIIATAIALLGIDWQFIIIPLVVAPIFYASAKWYLRVAPPKYAAERAAMGERARRVLEAIRGRNSVRAYQMENKMHQRIFESSWGVVSNGVSARVTMIRLNQVTLLCEFLMVTGTIVIGYFLVQNGAVTVGAVTGAALMMIRVRGPLMHLMRVLDTVQSGYASLARIVGVTLNPPKAVPHAGAPEAKGEVILRDVSFGYGDGWAVDDVNLQLKPGQSAALVGASGAGKSTVAALLAGLRIPNQGEVLIDGIPVAALSDAERKLRIALVSQEVHVFSGTLREDLTLAQPNATDDELLDALRRVNAMSWFETLADGLDTVVGAQGVAIEPLEAQQLALARVLLLDPKVIVMDEATAEAGSAGASKLEDAALEVQKGRTSVVVAHRLDQACVADVILVMDHGKVVERGSHGELVSMGGRYATLWDAWQRGRA